IAAAAVTEMSLHAYMSSMTLEADAFSAGGDAFVEIAVAEGLISAACPECPSCCEHIPHAIQAGIVSGRMYEREAQLANGIRSTESYFNAAVEAYSVFIDVIYGGQLSVIAHTSDVLMGHQLDSLKNLNAPQSSPLPDGVGLVNVRNFACALEGAPT